MNIAMFCNVYEPIIGGLERSVATFAEDLRREGHRVLIVTLAFPGAEESDELIFRLPAVKEVGGTPFSFKLPVPAGLKERLDAFAPDVIHSHHPFMVGDTALRAARRRGLPITFTHHTLYECYTYQFSCDSPAFERIAMAVATGYANLCDLVIAPTDSIKDIIRRRGVRTPIQVIPTGIDLKLYGNGQRQDFRRRYGIPENAFVLGYLGRVVEAKNMSFLTQAAVQFLAKSPDVWFLVVGEGDSADEVHRRTQEAGVADRVVLAGSLSGHAAADAYAAMDLFAFASRTETQGIVLVESFCAGVPVVALDASGTRDVLNDRCGILLPAETSFEQFAQELQRLKEDPELRSRLSAGARKRSCDFERGQCARKLLSAYIQMKEQIHPPQAKETELWTTLQNQFATEWHLFKEKLSVVAAAMTNDKAP